VIRLGRKLFRKRVRTFALAGMCALLATGMALAQAMPYARTYQKSQAEVDTALKELQAYSGQKLPIVDGFVAAGDKPLNGYERAFYQFSIELIPGSSGGTIVQVTAKITAWYADRDPAKSGYQVVPSNGRLELDLLDRLDERLGGKPASSMVRPGSNSTINAPKPKLDLGGVPGAAIPHTSSAAGTSGTSSPDELGDLRSKREGEEKRMRELNEELQGLQDIQKHQSHPPNLVVVKKSGTPVLARPAEGAHLLFNAEANDEFEFIDNQGPWIHVQISGPSRGYIHRSNLDLPELIAERLKSPNGVAAPEKSAAFRVARQDNSNFPGDWQPLKGKTVRIYTVQPASQDPKETGPRAKLVYAGTLFQDSVAETAASSPPVEGVVVIFDSADGGILGATLESVKQFAAGTLSAEAFWKQCYMDPPEAFQEPRKP